MLRQFHFRNFLSFDQSGPGSFHTLSMMTAQSRDHPKHVLEDSLDELLPLTMVLGSTGSGKSSLIRAIEFMQTCVLQSIPPKMYSAQNRNSPVCREETSLFETELAADGKNLVYGFEAFLPTGTFCREWLIVKDPADSSESFLFEREPASGTFAADSKDTALQKRLLLYLSDERQNCRRLFLPDLENSTFVRTFPSAAPIRQVMDWFRNRLRILSPTGIRADFSPVSEEERIRRLEHILHSFDTGITGIQTFPFTLESLLFKMTEAGQNTLLSSIQKNRQNLRAGETMTCHLAVKDNLYLVSLTEEEVRVQQLHFIHSGSDRPVQFAWTEESAGVQRLIQLAEALIESEEAVFVIDDLDQSLHAQMTFHFLSAFLEKSRRSRAQLICTAHTLCLSDPDSFRLEETMIVHRDKHGNSALYSMSGFQEKFGLSAVYTGLIICR